MKSVGNEMSSPPTALVHHSVLDTTGATSSKIASASIVPVEAWRWGLAFGGHRAVAIAAVKDGKFR